MTDFERGLECARSGRFREAICWYDKALATNPDNKSEILDQKARALSQLDRYGEAAECLNQIVREHPDDYKAILWLGIMQHQQGNYKKAYRKYDEALGNGNAGCLFAAIGAFSAIALPRVKLFHRR
ncbi:MAG: tetratricopeptide repeat protein [Spirulina sp.]